MIPTAVIVFDRVYVSAWGNAHQDSVKPAVRSGRVVGHNRLFLREKDNDIMVGGSLCVSPVAFLRLDPEPCFLEQTSHFIPKIVIRSEGVRVVRDELLVFEQ